MFGEDGKVRSVLSVEDFEPRLECQWAEMWQRKSWIGGVLTQMLVGLQILRDSTQHHPESPSALMLSEHLP